VNKKIVIIVLGLFVLGSCKEKNTVKTPVYAPDRSDFTIAANQAYLLICDSAAKQTARQIQDSVSFSIQYDKITKSRFQLLNSLGKQGLVKAFNNQVRDLLTESVQDLHIPASDFMRITEHDVPQNLLKRKVLVQRYLEPKHDSLRQMVLRDVSAKYIGSRAQSIWKQNNMLYNQYYSVNESPGFEFNPIVNRAIILLVQNAAIQEDSIKANYANWENKPAAKAMRYALKH